MDAILIIFLIIIAIYVTYKNVKLLKSYHLSKDYVNICNAVLAKHDKAYELINDYLSKQQSQEFINKVLVLKLYYELSNNIGFQDTLDKLYIKNIYYKNGLFNYRLAIRNSDVIIFVMLIIICANRRGEEEVANKLYNAYLSISELSGRVDYNELLCLINTLQKNTEPKFMLDLIAGEYTGYKYEKNMINLYKRFAVATLSYKHINYDPYFEKDLIIFARSKIGSIVLKDYYLYDKYVIQEGGTKQ